MVSKPRVCSFTAANICRCKTDKVTKIKKKGKTHTHTHTHTHTKKKPPEGRFRSPKADFASSYTKFILRKSEVGRCKVTARFQRQQRTRTDLRLQANTLICSDKVFAAVPLEPCQLRAVIRWKIVTPRPED